MLSSEQYADILTKGLRLCFKHTATISILDSPFLSLREDVKDSDLMVYKGTLVTRLQRLLKKLVRVN